MTVTEELTQKGKLAKEASYQLAVLPNEIKNKALFAMADALCNETEFLLAENTQDLALGKEHGMNAGLLDRLALNPDRIAAMAEGLRQVAELPDPIGETVSQTVRPNGLRIQKVRVPLGVIGIIYEARPNVTADAAALCLKSGNAVILRGGKEAANSNRAIVKVMQDSAYAVGLPVGSLNLVCNTERESATALMRLNEYLDVIIPRGGAGLIRSVMENATVPAIETGTGNCHVYVDAEADLAMAKSIVINAKTQRPSVCNAEEKLLVHTAIAEKFLPDILSSLTELGVTVVGDERTRSIYPDALPATEDDWGTEYLDLKIGVKVVDSAEEAITHINRYNSRHSDAIVTENAATAQTFQNSVDAAAVYVNASTRFTDGFEFGFGAEIGISTQKLHARGPMGLTELTSCKYLICGDGQIRG